MMRDYRGDGEREGYFAELRIGSEEGSCVRLMDPCHTQLEAGE